jgi:ABC-2 type transport system ATP-binding protein
MSSLLTVEHLVKRYGSTTVLDGIDLRVEPGSIVGLIGPNGAGKTTLFKCVLDIARPTAGTVNVFGAPVGPSTFERLAYVAEESSSMLQTLGRTRVDDLHEFQRRSFGKRYDAKRAREVRGLFGIDDNRFFGRLSKGQRTALWLSLAFAVRPALYVLDEPGSGLDPEHQRVLLDLMIDVASDGEAGIVFSSHQISAVERAADRVAVLRNGRIVLDADLETLKQRERILQAYFDVDAPNPNGLAEDPRVRKIDRSERMLRVYVSDGEAEIANHLQALNPRALESFNPDLETIYLTTSAPAARGGERS